MDKKYSGGCVDFIDDGKITGILKTTSEDPVRVRELIAKSMEKKPLAPEETAVLLAAEKPELVEEIFAAAKKLKKDVYGNRIVIFAPLYIGNLCVNNCAYCAFRKSNAETVRTTLGKEDVIKQIEALEDKGHKRLILVFGESPKYNAEFMAETVRTVYSVKKGRGEIRRVNINAAPTDIESYKIIKAAGIGTYQIFQETYHHETYKKMHQGTGPKTDYLYRLDGLFRAFEGGCDDVGIGALFGLYNWRFEVLGLVTHSLKLQERFGVGPHTISFPRLRPALGVNLDKKYFVSDYDFKRLVAILRLSVPYTGMILTAREPANVRRELMEFGVSQIDAGTRVELAGYTDKGTKQKTDREQFEIGDMRSLDEILRELLQNDYIPSFCTSCYRSGRTGKQFMEFAIPGFIEQFCTPNALLTLAEYLQDYATPETKQDGEALIKREIAKIPDGSMKSKLLERIDGIMKTGKRDLYF
ncbi:MAG: [FeFe] hydrogenase H-cluster radical SAM maturase HydG [Lentisphaerae bacterium GWF2_44_16]|nr:MAG: [FeFe] hydrogenase H-cluster radical SAM maturase HydG [Lentisphaerae bacterium GWF2_44_16]